MVKPFRIPRRKRGESIGQWVARVDEEMRRVEEANTRRKGGICRSEGGGAVQVDDGVDEGRSV